MSRALLVLNSDADRAKAATWCLKVPAGSRVEFKKPRRTLPQNDRMWAMLTDIAAQVQWHGQHLTPEDWKEVFSASLRRELRWVPNIDNDGMVLLGQRTSDMTTEEMSNLIDLIAAFGAREGVVFSEGSRSAEVPNTASAAAA